MGFSHDQKKKYVKSTSGHELLPFDEFDGLWFPDKNSKSTKAREKKIMNLNARDIVVEHIGSRLFIMSLFTNEDSGSKIEHKNCTIFRIFPVIAIRS